MDRRTSELQHKLTSLYTPRGDQRRTAILEATIDAIASGEVAAVNFERVAKLCKIRRSLVAYYFESPDTLTRSAIEYALSFGQDFAVEHVMAATTAEARLNAFVEANFEWLEKFPKHAAVFALLNYYAVCNDSYRTLSQSLAKMAESRLEAILLGGPLKKGKKSEAAEVAAALRSHLIAALARFFSTKPRGALTEEKRRTLRAFRSLSSQVWEN